MIALNHYRHHINMQMLYIAFSGKKYRSSFLEEVMREWSLTGRMRWSWWNPVKVLLVHLQISCAAVVSAELVHCGMRWEGLLRESGE